MLLPHGYEGQGPEHSIRPSRSVSCNSAPSGNHAGLRTVTTPAQYVSRAAPAGGASSYRKPLVIMSPKSLLRHKMSVSSITTLSDGEFRLIIPEIENLPADTVRRVVFCSGKVYYDLLEARQVNGIEDVALIRIEQLYPFPIAEFAKLIELYAAVDEIVWCQEEPQNQGAWYQIRHRLQEPLKDHQQLYYAGRPSAAAPASGIFKVHLQQQQALVEAALDIETKATKTDKPRTTKRKK